MTDHTTYTVTINEEQADLIYNALQGGYDPSETWVELVTLFDPKNRDTKIGLNRDMINDLTA